MAGGPIPRPTDAELAILSVLWEHGPSTVREVHEELSRGDSMRYTTTLKQLQIMIEKGLLVRDDSVFKHIYRPAISAERTEKQIVGDMLEKVFSGSAERLVMRALSAKGVTAKELKKIRQLLDKMEA